MNRLKRIFFSLFPKPRRPISIWDTLPLFAFLMLYAAAVVGLEWSDTLLFGRPLFFGLILFAAWVWWMHAAGYSGFGRTRGLVALFTRLTLLGLFVMLLAEPRAVRERDTLSVVYAVDISASIDQTDHALEFVASTVQDKPQRDEAGLIVFGGNASVELPPRQSFPLEGNQIALNSRIKRDATDLEQALSLSAAMLPEENPGRIVLISDGTATQGNLSRVLDELKARGIAVDVLPIQYQYEEEIWLEQLELPQYVKIGESYDAFVVMSSLNAGRGRLVLKENGQTIYEVDVEYRAGKNRYRIPVRLREAGYYEYTANMIVDEGRDNLRENNEVINYIFVEGEGRVLVVTQPEAIRDDRDHADLVRALREGKRAVDVVDAYAFPQDSLSLMPYDAILFVNAAADQFDALQVQALHDSVKDLGIGYMMVGGPNSYGPGGWHNTLVEKTLPVSMDVTKKKILPKGALAIILHTCEFPEGNTWAKRITKQAIKVLGAKDEVGVIAFDWEKGDKWIFELTPAGEYEKLFPKINAAEIGDMPSFVGSMQMGYNALVNSDAATRHMIIISDGDPVPPPPTLLKQFQDNKITVSTVSVFPHGGLEIGMMQSIAQQTGGKYYDVKSPDELPSIFIKEAKTLKRGMIQNKTVSPKVAFPSTVLKGIAGLPDLHGYVLTTPKEKLVETILIAPTEEDDQIDPLLAKWKYGLGTTAAFTSDLSPNWGKDWVNWEQYQAFVTQLLLSISRVRTDSHLRMWTYTQGNEGVAVVEDYHPEDTFLDLVAEVSGPDGKSELIELKQVGPRRYQAALPLWGQGRYQIIAHPIGGDREDDRVMKGLIVPYSPEYRLFRSNPIVLKEIHESTGGVELSSKSTAKDIYERERETKKSSLPVFDWFLIALACLLPLDVAVRRVQLDWYAVKSWFGLDRRRGPTTETMGALLAAKKAVGDKLEVKRKEKPTAPTTPAYLQAKRPHAAGPKPKPRPQPTQKPQPPPAGRDTSTMSRLLERKRKRREQDDDSR